MVRIYSVYHFSGQLVDTVDDMSALTLTNHNKLLVAQGYYTVEVKDLLSDKKTPSFVFPTVDKVQYITHCAAGGYVATLEGKQTFQKSDVLSVRVYTNWEPNNKQFSKTSKRFVRARMAGMVTPSSAITDEDYLDMIEIPITFMSPTTITCCQKSGKLLIACGPTIHLFNQVYKCGSSKNSQFMDFIARAEVFDLVFQPIAAVICEDVIAAYSCDMISVFKLKKVNESPYESSSVEDADAKNNKSNNTSKFRDLGVVTTDGALYIDGILKLIDENREAELLGLVHPSSLPLKVPLKGISNSLSTIGEKRFPFGILNKKYKCEFKNGKVEDNYVVTLSEQSPFVIGESLLALKMNDSDDELVSKIALQILPAEISTVQNNGDLNNCCGKIHFFFATEQEGYLFCTPQGNLNENLQCVAVFNFSAKVISATFEVCFLHILTEAGLETYNLPTLHSVVFNKNCNVNNSSQITSIFGMRPFMGVVDFISSDNLITIFSSANDEKKGKLSLPWTVYSLKMPTIYDVYREIISLAHEYKTENYESYKYLILEAFLILQTALRLQLPLNSVEDKSIIRNNHITNAMELAQLYFKSEDINDVLTGCAVILACGTDPLEFIRKLDYSVTDINIVTGITFLLETWVSKKKASLSEENFQFIIKLLGVNGEDEKLALFLLSNEDICRSCGHKAVQYLNNHFISNQEDSNVHVLYALCVLYTQECHQAEVAKILNTVQKQEEQKCLFIEVISEYWVFLFDEASTGNENLSSFSELTSLLIENLPLEISSILSELILKKKKCVMTDIVQMVLKLFPCSVSVQNGHLVLRSLLESIFASKLIVDFREPTVDNYLKILIRSYLAQLFVKDSDMRNDSKLVNYKPIFTDALPEYVEYLPKVKNISYLTLRRLQELVWNKIVTEDTVKEIVEGLPTLELKLNILAMLSEFDVIRPLITHNFNEAIFPFAKFSFHGVKSWRDLVILIQNHISDLKNSEQDFIVYERIFYDILDHLALTMPPSQLSSVLESVVTHEDELFRRYIMKAQQNSYANDVKTLIINTSQQLLHSNSL